MFNKIQILKGAVKKIKALNRPPATNRIKDRVNEVLYWGSDHGDPLRYIGTIERSPAAVRCFRKLIEYTYGDGFKSNRLGATQINDKQTFNDLLAYTSSQIWKLGGFSWCVKWQLDDDLTPRISKIYPIPFETVRLGIPDENGNVTYFVANPYFGSVEYEKKYNEFYFEYNPDPRVISEQISECNEKGVPYRGQILWVANNSEYARFYPRPDWAGDSLNEGGGYQAMTNDFLLNQVLGKDLNQGFIQNNIIKMIGDPDQPIEAHRERYNDGKSYTTIGEEFKDFLDSNFQGIDSDSTIVLWSKIKEEFPEIEGFPTNFNYEKLKDVAEKVEKTVVATLSVPPILAGIESSGSISKDDIMTASYLMYSVVRMNQQTIERTVAKVLRHWNDPLLLIEGTEIENYRPFPEEKSIDPLIWEELTSEERRDWIRNNTNVELKEEELQAFAKKAESFTDYPKAASDNAQKVLDWIEEHGRDEVDGMTRVGLARANQLANREPISEETVARMAAFERHRENAEIAEEFRGTPWKDRGYVAWLGWGGDEGIAWAQRKIDSLEE